MEGRTANGIKLSWAEMQNGLTDMILGERYTVFASELSHAILANITLDS